MSEKEIPKRCACTGANLDKFIQPIILKVLSKEPLTRYEVVKRISQYSIFSAEKPDASGVYRYIATFQENGLVQRLPERQADTRILFTVTLLGKECIENWIHTLEDYNDSIGTLISELNK